MAWYGDCLTVGDKEYIYYGGYAQGHKVRSDRTLGMGMLRKNGFVSRDAGIESGWLKSDVSGVRPIHQQAAQRPNRNATVGTT